MGMSWKEILGYADTIKWIAFKYSSGSKELAEDVAHEVMLKLYEDKRLNIKKFDPNKKDAAIRTTIRNKTLKVLKSKKIGRWPVDSLDKLNEQGYQIDTQGNIARDPYYTKHPFDEDDPQTTKIDGG